MYSLQKQYNLTPGNYTKEMKDVGRFFRKELHALMQMAVKRSPRTGGVPDTTQAR